MLYTNPIHDYTDYILEELGISPDQLKEKEREENDANTNPDNKESNVTEKPKLKSKARTFKGAASNENPKKE